MRGRSARDRINLSESGRLSERSPGASFRKRSPSGDVEGVPSGTSEMFRTYASPCALSIAITPRPSRNCEFERSAGGVNARRPCGTHRRSGAKSVDAAEHRLTIYARWASDLRQPGGEIRRTDPAHKSRCHRSKDSNANCNELCAGVSRGFAIDPRSIVRNIALR